MGMGDHILDYGVKTQKATVQICISLCIIVTRLDWVWVIFYMFTAIVDSGICCSVVGILVYVFSTTTRYVKYVKVYFLTVKTKIQVPTG